MANQKKHTLIGGAFILLMSGIIVKFIGYLYNIPLTDYWLQGEGMGYYNAAYTSLYMPVYTLTLTGFPTAIAKIIAELNAKQQYRDVIQARKAANKLFLCLGLTGSIVILAAAKPFVTHLIDNPLSYYCVLAVAPSIVFSGLLSAKRGFDQGMRNMTSTALTQIIEVMSKTAFGLGACALTLKLLTAEYAEKGTVMGQVTASAADANSLILALSAAAAMFAVTFSVIVAYLFFVIRDSRRKELYTPQQLAESPEPKSGKHYVKFILTFGLPIALSSLVGTFTQTIDTAMLQRLINDFMEVRPGELYAAYGGLIDSIEPDKVANFLYGSYSAYAQKLFGLLPALTGTFTVSTLPIISEMWASKNREGLNKSASSCIRMTAFIGAPIGMGLCALAKPILSFVFSNSAIEVEVATLPLMIIGAFGVISICGGPIFCIFNAVGRIDIPIKLTIIGSVLKIATTYFLVRVPEINVVAAAISNVVFYGFIMIVGFILLKRIVDYKVPLFSVIVKPALAGAICGICARLAYTALPGGRMSTILAIGVGMVAYIAAVVLLRVLPREDLSALPGGKRIVAALEKIGALK